MNLPIQKINFAVGPVQLSDEIKKIGSSSIPYFRTKEFSELIFENERLIKIFVNSTDDSKVVFLTGSGTSAMEAAVINVFSKSDNLLIINGGSFGQRFCDICTIYEIPFTEIKLSVGQNITQERLSEYDKKGFTGFLVNMHETSTGVLYDMQIISDFCRKNNLIFVIDAISSFIADELDMQKLGADIILTGSQKALAIPPGVSILVLSPRICEKILCNNPKCYYLNLISAIKNAERGQTPFTPAVGILIQLNARLNQIAKIGLEEERKKIQNIAFDFRTRIKNYPFKIISSSLSNTLTPLSPLSPKVSAYHLFEILKEEYSIIICPNAGELANTVFRVGHIGNLSLSDNDTLFFAFDNLINKNII